MYSALSVCLFVCLKRIPPAVSLRRYEWLAFTTRNKWLSVTVGKDEGHFLDLCAKYDPVMQCSRVAVTIALCREVEILRSLAEYFPGAHFVVVNVIYCLLLFIIHSFNALTLSFGCQEEHPASKTACFSNTQRFSFGGPGVIWSNRKSRLHTAIFPCESGSAGWPLFSISIYSYSETDDARFVFYKQDVLPVAEPTAVAKSYYLEKLARPGVIFG